MKPIVVWGASGHAKVLAEFLAAIGFELVAAFDNDADAAARFQRVPTYVGRGGFGRWREGFGRTAGCLVAIGGARGRIRLEIQEFLAASGLQPEIAVHPTAFVAGDARLGKGSQVLAGAIVGVEADLGESCIVNTAASVDHEARLGKGVHIAPGATLAGCVSVGDFSLIGPGAVILPRVRVGANVIVGGGAVVTRDIPDNQVVYGNPARFIRDNPSDHRP